MMVLVCLQVEDGLQSKGWSLGDASLKISFLETAVSAVGIGMEREDGVGWDLRKMVKV